jgi:arylsulfatase
VKCSRLVRIACFVLVLLFVCFGAVLTGARASDRPDILILMPDQWRGDCLSVLGHPAVRTPELDRLAKQGTLFRRAYATVPSCIPARYAMLTGLFPQTSGVVGYRGGIPVTAPTKPQILRDAGYQTALVGRNMHQAAGPEALGYLLNIGGSTHVSGDDYDRALLAAAPDTGGIKALASSMGLSYNHWQAAPWPLADELHPTTWVARQARDVVERTPLDEPLFLTASFYAPHPPLFPPQRYFDAYLQKELPEPARGDWVDWDKITAEGSYGGSRVLLEGQRLRAAQAGYFGLIEHLDAEFAPLVAAFRARSEKAGRPWLVIVTSDHGEMLGDHGYFRKCEPYEGSANIPMIIAGSGELRFRAGQRSFQPVALEDLFPTLAELAGIEAPEVDGVSLVPVLRGEQQKVRPWLHFEHSPIYSQPQGFHALTDGRMKYIWRPADGVEQLFDLEADPREERDLSSDAAGRDQLLRWRRLLIQRLAPRPEGFSDGQQLIPGRPYPPFQASVRRKETPVAVRRPVADPLPALTTLSDPAIEYQVPDKPYVVLQRADIQAVIVDNSAVDDDVLPGHRAGYNGVGSLRHAKRWKNVFVPSVAGLNFEHIHDGTVQQRTVLFEPRHAPMELRRIDPHTAELYQPPTPHYGLESCHRYHLLEDGTIEMTFECIPRRAAFAHGYVGLFWASYIHQPESLDIHFKGSTEGQQEPSGWIRGVTPSHGVLATHLADDDHRTFAHDPHFPLTLVFHRSRHRFTEPWYYGVSHGMALVFLFRSQDQPRLTQSPSGGGRGNPAWDFQYFIADYEVDKRYQMVMRAMYLPYESPEQVEQASMIHRRALEEPQSTQFNSVN